jgi:hypothetical protein
LGRKASDMGGVLSALRTGRKREGIGWIDLQWSPVDKPSISRIKKSRSAADGTASS